MTRALPLTRAALEAAFVAAERDRLKPCNHRHAEAVKLKRLILAAFRELQEQEEVT